MRIIHAGLFASGFMYALLPELVLKPAAAPPASVFMKVFAVLALASCAAALVLRKRFLEPSAEVLRMNPNDVEAVKRWQTGTLVSLASAELIIMSGLMLRLLGTPLSQSAIFYVTGALMMVILTPQRP